ncbi:hypothetical protein ACFQ68_16340 [Amycolatopsis japonica]|uniref:hypothetical protein n=1 Tax=Amycolatopsis japonica TaxID=208439 RepID=UPI003672B83F
MDPFVLMVHATAGGRLCLVVDGVVRPVTDEVLGSWLRGLPELGVSARSLVDPVVVLTCNRGVVRQELADEVGRLVWFPHGDVRVNAGLRDPVDPGAGVMWVSLHPGRDGRGGRFRSSWPQGPAGVRVRWEYRSRFGSVPGRWLVERSAFAGFPVPDGLSPQVFGGGRVRGLSYFDRRDRESRAAALAAPMVGSSYVVWTPNEAYRPGAPDQGGGVARPWHSRDLGVLPFDLEGVVVVVGYFAGGRFAVYDERRDVSYWETPQEFGKRLRTDLAAAGGPARVLLLTDFDAVPDRARGEVARGLGGVLITVNRPSTLFLDQDTIGTPGTRIALLPDHQADTVPVWTSTNATGTPQTFDETVRRARSEAARDYTRSGADFVTAVAELRQAHLARDRARAVLDGPGSSRSPQVHAAAEHHLAQARDRFAAAETRFDLAGGRLAPLGLAWLADEHELDTTGITWARAEAATLLGRPPIVASPASGSEARERVAEFLRQGRTAEALALLRTARHTRQQPAPAWTNLSQPAPVAWEKMPAGTAETLRARARTIIAQLTRPPVFLEHPTETQHHLWTIHNALVDRIAYRIHQTDLGQQPPDHHTPEDLARTLTTDLGLPRTHGLPGGTPPTQPIPHPTHTEPSRYEELRQLLVDWEPKNLKNPAPGDTLEAYITGHPELSVAFPLNSRDGWGRVTDPGTSEAVHQWVLKWGDKISGAKIAKLSGTLLTGRMVLSMRNAANSSEEKVMRRLLEKLVSWKPSKIKGNTLAAYIAGDEELRLAFPLETDEHGELINLGTKRAINLWVLRWRRRLATAGDVAKMSGGLIDEESVLSVWEGGNVLGKATPEQIRKLVGWKPKKPTDPNDNLEVYIESDPELSVAFPLDKYEGGKIKDDGTREAVHEWILTWRGVVGPRVVARWSGKLAAWAGVVVVWNSEWAATKKVTPAKVKATPAQVKKLVDWSPRYKGDTLKAYIVGDPELNVAFPLDKYDNSGFLYNDTREAVRKWVLRWRGSEYSAEWVANSSGGLVPPSSVRSIWATVVASKERATAAQIEMLAGWRPRDPKDPADTLKAYIIGDATFREVFPLGKSGREFVDPDTREAMSRWVRGWVGENVEPRDVAKWSGGIFDEAKVARMWKRGINARDRLKSSSGAAVEEAAQSTKAAELGLRLVDVPRDSDSFYAAVLQTVPSEVWGPRLTSLGKEPSSGGLRQAVADAYSHEYRQGPSYFDVVVNVVDGIRTPGYWDSKSRDMVVRLVTDVLGVNLQTITPAGDVPTSGVTINIGRPTYYVAYDGADHYLATEPLNPAVVQASDAPNLPGRAGAARPDHSMSDGDPALPVRAAADAPRLTFAEPEPASSGLGGTPDNLAEGASPPQSATVDPASTDPSQAPDPVARLVAYRKGMGGHGTLKAFIRKDEQLRATFRLTKKKGRIVDLGTRTAVHKWVLELQGTENHETKLPITEEDVEEWSGEIMTRDVVADMWRIANASKAKATPEQIRELVDWEPANLEQPDPGDTLRAYIVDDPHRSLAFPLDKVKRILVNDGTSEAVRKWILKWRGKASERNVVLMSGNIVSKDNVSVVWNASAPSRPTPEQSERLVGWEPRNQEDEPDPGDTLEVYLDENADLLAVFPLGKDETGKFIVDDTRIVLQRWALRWHGIDPEKVAKWSGTLLSARTIADVWRAKFGSIRLKSSSGAAVEGAVGFDENGVPRVDPTSPEPQKREVAGWSGSTSTGDLSRLDESSQEQLSTFVNIFAANVEVLAAQNREMPDARLRAAVSDKWKKVQAEKQFDLIEKRLRDAVRKRDLDAEKLGLTFARHHVYPPAGLPDLTISVLYSAEGYRPALELNLQFDLQEGAEAFSVVEIRRLRRILDDLVRRADADESTVLVMRLVVGREELKDGLTSEITAQMKEAVRAAKPRAQGGDIENFIENHVVYRALVKPAHTAQLALDIIGSGVSEGSARNRSTSSEAAVEGAAQSVKAAELGLRLVDVPQNDDSFYAAVLRTVPRQVWGTRLASRGRELSANGLRQAVADAYQWRRRFSGQVPNVVDTPGIEDRIRKQGHWDSESGAIAVRLVPDVLGVNLKTITREGGESANGVDIHDDRDTYYVAYNGVDHYLATESAPVAGQAPHAPSPLERVGPVGPDLSLSDGEPARAGSVSEPHNLTDGASPARPAPADPAHAGPSRDLELRQLVVDWRRGDGGYTTLKALITGVPELSAAFPLDEDDSGEFTDPRTSDALHKWILALRDVPDPDSDPGTGRTIRPDQVEEWSGGLIERSTVVRAWRAAAARARVALDSDDDVSDGPVPKRLKSSGAAVEGTAQSAKAAELGLRLIDVPQDRDSFYAAVLRTVPWSVWEPKLSSLGKAPDSVGLRQATADAYELNADDVVSDGPGIEEGIRTPGYWDSDSRDIVVRFVTDVLGVNLRTITPAGEAPNTSVTIHIGRPTYYVAYDGVDRYLATEPFDPTVGQAAQAPNPPERAGADVSMSDGEPALPVQHESGPASEGIPEEVRDSIVSLVPPEGGFATLRAALEDALGPDVDLETPSIRKLVGEWALRMLDTTPSPPAKVAELSDGLITVHQVVTLYNTTHSAGFGDTGTIHWVDQEYKHVTWPASENPARPAVVDKRLRPIVGMDGQFTWRDPADPLFRVHPLFADHDGEVHPALVARADEITARVGAGKKFFRDISHSKRDRRLPFMTDRELDDHWTALANEAVVRMRNLVRTARNPARGAVQLAPLHPTPGQRVYVTQVKKKHVPSRERVLVGSYQLCLADPPGSSPRSEWPAFTNNRFIHFYLGAMTMDDRRGIYTMQAGQGWAACVIDAERAANSTAFANTALTAKGKLDNTRTNAAFLEVTFTFPDFRKPGRTFEIATTILVLLDNAFDRITNPFGIILPTYGGGYPI